MKLSAYSLKCNLFNVKSLDSDACDCIMLTFDSSPPEGRPEQVVLVCLCVVVYHLLGRIPRAFPCSFTEGELAVCLQIVFIPLYPIVVISCQVSLQWRCYKCKSQVMWNFRLLSILSEIFAVNAYYHSYWVIEFDQELAVIKDHIKEHLKTVLSKIFF